MFGLGAGEIFLILAFALIFIGPKKLPELARSLGKGVREFQNAKDELLNQVKQGDDDNDEPTMIAEASTEPLKESTDEPSDDSHHNDDAEQKKG